MIFKQAFVNYLNIKVSVLLINHLQSYKEARKCIIKFKDAKTRDRITSYQLSIDRASLYSFDPFYRRGGEIGETDDETQSGSATDIIGTSEVIISC